MLRCHTIPLNWCKISVPYLNLTVRLGDQMVVNVTSLTKANVFHAIQYSSLLPPHNVKYLDRDLLLRIIYKRVHLLLATRQLEAALTHPGVVASREALCRTLNTKSKAQSTKRKKKLSSKYINSNAKFKDARKHRVMQ